MGNIHTVGPNQALIVSGQYQENVPLEMLNVGAMRGSEDVLY